jgi:hypothetical protein
MFTKSALYFSPSTRAPRYSYFCIATSGSGSFAWLRPLHNKSEKTSRNMNFAKRSILIVSFATAVFGSSERHFAASTDDLTRLFDLESRLAKKLWVHLENEKVTESTVRVK